MSLEEPESYSFSVMEEETQISRRYSIIISRDGYPGSDRVVADKLQQPFADQLRDKLALAQLRPGEIKRIQDYGARQQRDNPEWVTVY